MSSAEISTVSNFLANEVTNKTFLKALEDNESVINENTEIIDMSGSSLYISDWGEDGTMRFSLKEGQTIDEDTALDELLNSSSLEYISFDENADNNSELAIFFNDEGNVRNILIDENDDGMEETSRMFENQILSSEFLDTDLDGNYNFQNQYDKEGNLTLTVNYEYDEDGNIISKEYSYPDEENDSKITYNYEDGGIVSGDEDSDNDGDVDYSRSYDENGNLVVEDKRNFLDKLKDLFGF